MPTSTKVQPPLSHPATLDCTVASNVTSSLVSDLSAEGLEGRATSKELSLQNSIVFKQHNVQYSKILGIPKFSIICRTTCCKPPVTVSSWGVYGKGNHLHQERNVKKSAYSKDVNRRALGGAEQAGSQWLSIPLHLCRLRSCWCDRDEDCRSCSYSKCI